MPGCDLRKKPLWNDARRRTNDQHWYLYFRSPKYLESHPRQVFLRYRPPPFSKADSVGRTLYARRWIFEWFDIGKVPRLRSDPRCCSAMFPVQIPDGNAAWDLRGLNVRRGGLGSD